MAYVTLDSNGNVTGVFTVPQPQLSGYTTIPDNDPRLASFGHALPPTIPKVAFLALFTSAEMMAISAAARTNDAINVWLITAEAYETIDLANPTTKAGLDALVAAGLLTSARETAILANQPHS